VEERELIVETMVVGFSPVAQQLFLRILQTYTPPAAP
jgi:hypothetical protein